MKAKKTPPRVLGAASGKTIIIAAGGTGGHITPGISIAEDWLQQGGSVILATLAKNLDYPDIITLARNEYKYVADLDTSFGELPPVTCIAGSISQVVLNLVVNAAHAVGDTAKTSGGKGRISVSTHVEGGHAIITVHDNGSGIADAVRPHIFEPFYTTKAVGKGTGQGLALAWAIVSGDHAGAIDVESAPGQGATFRVRLPISGRATTRLTAEAA